MKGAVPLRDRLLAEGPFTFWSVLLLYLMLAALLVYRYNVIDGDNLARVANSYFVLFSRDPHLAAIGFVWNPLPSLAELPLLLIRPLWPDLVRLGFAGNVMGAVFMAGAVFQLNRTLAEISLGRVVRLGITVLFALHPFLLWYGSIGLSEGPMLFFLLFSLRHLLAWMRTRRTQEQVLVGLGLAASYLTRYEPALTAVAVITFVAVFSYRCSGRRNRLETAAVDALLVGFPFVASFVLWAGASWFIVGHPLDQLSSVYGNTAQLRLMKLEGNADIINYSGVSVSAAISAASRLLTGEPFAPVIVLVALVLGAVRRDVRVAAVAVIFGPPLGFEFLAYVFGITGLLVRYFIAIVPLTLLLAALILAPSGGNAGTVARVPRRVGVRLAIGTSAVLAMLVAGLPSTGTALVTRSWARYDALYLGHVFLAYNKLADDQQRVIKIYFLERDIAARLDQMRLPRGSVLIDSGSGFAIVLASSNPKQFVITSDRDFNVVLDDPAATGVQYILLPENSGRGTLDGINRAYPSLYETGQGFATLAADFQNQSFGLSWRLYHISASG